MHHYVGSGGVVELEDVLDHFLFVGFDVTVFLAGVDHQADLLLGDLLLDVVRVDAKQPQDGVGRNRKKPHDRARHFRGEVQNAAHAHRDLFGIFHRDTLGNELTEHQRNVGKKQSNEDDGERIQRRIAEGGKADRVIQPIGEATGKVIGGKRRAEEAGQRDTDLNGGKKFFGILGQHEEPRRFFIPILRHFFDLLLIERDHGDLGAGEEGVHEDK